MGVPSLPSVLLRSTLSPSTFTFSLSKTSFCSLFSASDSSSSWVVCWHASSSPFLSSLSCVLSLGLSSLFFSSLLSCSLFCSMSSDLKAIWLASGLVHATPFFTLFASAYASTSGAFDLPICFIYWSALSPDGKRQTWSTETHRRSSRKRGSQYKSDMQCSTLWTEER